MSSAIITYFPLKARAEAIKLALHLAKIPYTINLVTDWGHQKEELTKSGVIAFGQIPLVQLDGMNMVQSLAILHYISKKYLMPNACEKTSYKIDMLLDEWNDVLNMYFTVFYEKTEPMESFLSGYCHNVLSLIEKVYVSNGTKFMATDSISIADCNGYTTLCRLLGEKADLLKDFPELKKWFDAMSADETVKEYLRECFVS